MALQKEKTLPSGESGNYWRISELHFRRAGMTVSATLSLYKSAELAAGGSSPLPASHTFIFVITQQEILGNVVAIAYAKIKAMIAALHPPISGSGEDSSRYPDLVGSIDA